jgi:peptide/nickel transport system substrate-binding protein
MDTQFAFSGSAEYKTIVKSSGVSEYTSGTQESRTAKALALVKKYYPTASATDSKVNVRFLHANTPTRNDLADLIAASAKLAGFNVVDTRLDDIFAEDDNASSSYDATMYGFSLSAISQANTTDVYKSDGGSNVWGWNSDKLDTILKSLQGDVLTPSQVTAKRLEADKIVIANYWGLPLYQNPNITAYNKALKGIKTAPIGPAVVWNFWDWHY